MKSKISVFEKCQSAVDELRHDFEGKYCEDDCVKCISSVPNRSTMSGSVSSPSVAALRMISTMIKFCIGRLSTNCPSFVDSSVIVSGDSGVCCITVFPKTNVNLASSGGIGMLKRAVKANAIGLRSSDPCSWRAVLSPQSPQYLSYPR